MLLKKCTVCNLYKNISFYRKGKDKDGLKYECKDCDDRRNKIRTQYIREQPPTEIKSIICSQCKIDKDVLYFNKNICSITGYQNTCKNCRKENRELDKEKISLSNKEWRINNKEYKAKKDKEYRENNIEAVRTNKRKYEKNKRADSPLFKLSTNLRKTMSSGLKNKNFGKNSSTLEILGCTFEDFKQYIEKQFLNWMSWENYGNVCETLEYNCSWDLDHIIPISYAKTEEEVYLLNHWSNFQPLCSKVNRWEKKNIVYSVCNIELNIET